MFGLPFATAFLLFGFPLIWVVYTLVFLAMTKDWERGRDGDDG